MKIGDYYLDQFYKPYCIVVLQIIDFPDNIGHRAKVIYTNAPNWAQKHTFMYVIPGYEYLIQVVMITIDNKVIPVSL